METGERLKISTVEGQVWLALYQLLLSEPCQQKYEFTDHNKLTLLKARTNNYVAITSSIMVVALETKQIFHRLIRVFPIACSAAEEVSEWTSSGANSSSG